MKKTNRKLIPAVAMLLISAIMLSTSSFAWFSMNSKVGATGMQVKATASKNLLIAGQLNDYATWGVTTDQVVAAAGAMLPATSNSGTQFFYPTTEKATAYNVSILNNASTADFAKADEAGTYYYETGLQLKSESKTESFTQVDVSAIKVLVDGMDITANAERHQIARSLRVSITIDGTTHLYAPVTGATTEYNSVADTSGVVGKMTVPTNALTLATDEVYTVTVGNTPVNVGVCIWFEGQDAGCTSALSAIETQNFEVQLEFTATGDAV